MATKTKLFADEARARKFQLWAIEHDYCTNYYRMINCGLVYVVEYWKY